MIFNPKIDLYIADGCGRCKYHATPQCKVRLWTKELELLRQLVIECGLTEELKWGVPCYTHNSKNILVVSAFKEFCSLSFFKGVLLKDNHHVLEKQGESSQSARIVKFSNIQEISEKSLILKEYILQAIELENLGAKVEFNKNPEPLPQELEKIFLENPEFKKAFFNLTPGRQRGYIIHFSQPKQSSTKSSRIVNNIHKIMNGQGLMDK
jgi:uncharacterized protein YdeI (YjbR/CyaY-like superfamily)